MRKSILFLVLLFTSNIFCRAQSPELPRIEASLPQIKDSLRYVDALNRMAMLLYEKNADSTFYYARQARAIADRLDYQKGKADALNNLGVFFDIKGSLQLALRYYNEGYAGYSQLKDSSNCVQSLMNIAMVYKEIGKDQRAIQHFNTALNRGKHLRKDSIMSLVIYNYLLAYPARFNHNTQKYYIEKARHIALKYKDKRTAIALDQLVADDLITRGDRKNGIALLEQTIARALNQKLFYVSMDMLIDLGDQLATNQSPSAAQAYQNGLTIAGKNGYLIYSQVLARKLFDFYSARGDTLAAAGYSRYLITLYDQEEKLNNSSGIDYLDYVLKEGQVTSLMIRSKYQVALLIFAITAFLLAIVVIMVIRKNLKRTRLLNNQVVSQNNEMKTALDALEQSQADNTRMMQIVAHDLRNPIGAIYSAASMMLEEGERSEDDITMLELIRTTGKNSLELVDDLLQVQFRAEDLKKELVPVGEMLKYCISLLTSKADAKGQQIKLQVVDVSIMASREKIWRVVSNLVANAIKFSPTGAVINVSMAYDAQQVRIEVSDNGIGIPAEIKDTIFDLFTKAKRSGTAGEQSFGLGLAISKQIVEAHNGKIWFESSPGKGTTFFVELPA